MKESDRINLSLFLADLRLNLIRRAMCTNAIDHWEVEAAMVLLYKMMKLPKPDFVWLKNPWQLHYAVCELARPGAFIKSSTFTQTWIDPNYDTVGNLPGPLFTIAKLDMSCGRSARFLLEDLLQRDFPEFFQILWAVLPQRELSALPQIVEVERRRQGSQTERGSDKWFQGQTIRAGVARGEQFFHRVAARANDIEWIANSLLHLAIVEMATDFYKVELASEDNYLRDCLFALTDAAHAFVCFENVCILSERPLVIHLDQDGRLHNQSGPALVYDEDVVIHAWHGSSVPAEALLCEPTIVRIENEHNLEIRRVLIERYGVQQYVLDSGATIIHHDECGTLYSKEVVRDEPILMVRVTNSTPEPDGEYKEYFLRVPPNMRSARQAVAWTFGLPEDEYFPEKQT